MPIYPITGTEFFVPNLSNIFDKMADQYVRLFLISYFWPYFVAGNIDDWIKMGVTLNGARPMCFR